MPIDLSNPSGFNAFWVNVVEAFREIGIGDYSDDDPTNWTVPSNLQDGSGDPILNDHIKGPVDGQTLASQHAYPVVWSVPQSWTPSYDTSKSDQGQLQVMVVVFAADQDQWYGFRKARELGGRIVNNLEADRALDGNASAVWLENFQTDFLVGGQNTRAQLQFCSAVYQIDAKRLL